MTSHPPPGPPREPSAREKMATAAADVLKDAAARREVMQARAQREEDRHALSRKRLHGWLVAAALVFAASLVWAIPQWRHPFAAPTGAVADRGARHTVAFAARLVQRYVRENGAPPGSLDDVGVHLPGLTYRHLGDQWELTLPVEANEVTFRSGEDLNAFEAAGPDSATFLQPTP